MALLAAVCDAAALPMASLSMSGIKHSAIVMSPFAVGCSPSPSNSCSKVASLAYHRPSDVFSPQGSLLGPLQCRRVCVRCLKPSTGTAESSWVQSKPVVRTSSQRTGWQVKSRMTDTCLIKAVTGGVHKLGPTVEIVQPRALLRELLHPNTSKSAEATANSTSCTSEQCSAILRAS